MEEQEGGAGVAGMRPLRERAEAALIEAYARDHLDDGELERRLDLIHRAASPAELRTLLQDLPSPAAELPAVRESAIAVGPPGAEGAGVGWSIAPEERVRSRQFLVGVLGGSTRKGAWTPARHVVAAACMGGVVLDFREARFPPGVTTVTVLAVMGGVEIKVPPGVGVDCGGSGILGGFEGTDQHPAYPGAPVLRIDGVALLGGVDVKVSTPSLPRGKKARRRLGRGEA